LAPRRTVSDLPVSPVTAGEEVLRNSRTPGERRPLRPTPAGRRGRRRRAATAPAGGFCSAGRASGAATASGPRGAGGAVKASLGGAVVGPQGRVAGDWARMPAVGVDRPDLGPAGPVPAEDQAPSVARPGCVVVARGVVGQVALAAPVRVRHPDVVVAVPVQG